MKRVLILLVAVLVAATACSGRRGEPSLVVGRPDGSTTTASPGPVLVPEPDVGRRPVPEPRAAPGLKGPNGQPYGTIAFRSDVPVPERLVFVLVAGSDARPGEDIRRTRADSIHLLAVDPITLEGTIVGFPRDGWVEIPGHGVEKINQALARGGPQLLAAAVRHLTGLPVDYYVLTGFRGLAAMVDELGGVHIHVDRRMNDRWSGARFEPGWHHFNGAEALAYSRNRSDVPYGDFSRSENQGKLILAALAKMRGEVADDGGLRRWVEVLLRHVDLDVPVDEAVSLAALGRRIDPASLRNVVVPGRVGTARGQSVVFFGEEAARLFLDLRPDAVIGPGRQPAPSTTAPAAAPTTAPPATTSTSRATATTATTPPTTRRGLVP